MSITEKRALDISIALKEWFIEEGRSETTPEVKALLTAILREDYFMHG